MQLVIVDEHHVVLLNMTIYLLKNHYRIIGNCFLSPVQWLYFFWEQAGVTPRIIISFNCNLISEIWNNAITSEHQPRHSNSIPCMAVSQSNLRRKKLHRTNQGSNFLGGSFSNRDVRAPIQFGRESQPQHLKRWIFLNNRPIHFHINSTNVIRTVKRNQLSFCSIETNKPLPAPVQCLVDQIQVQKSILVVATDHMPDHI